MIPTMGSPVPANTMSSLRTAWAICMAISSGRINSPAFAGSSGILSIKSINCSIDFAIVCSLLSLVTADCDGQGHFHPGCRFLASHHPRAVAGDAVSLEVEEPFGAQFHDEFFPALGPVNPLVHELLHVVGIAGGLVHVAHEGR